MTSGDHHPLHCDCAGGVGEGGAVLLSPGEEGEHGTEAGQHQRAPCLRLSVQAGTYMYNVVYVSQCKQVHTCTMSCMSLSASRYIHVQCRVCLSVQAGTYNVMYIHTIPSRYVHVLLVAVRLRSERVVCLCLCPPAV